MCCRLGDGDATCSGSVRLARSGVVCCCVWLSIGCPCAAPACLANERRKEKKKQRLQQEVVRLRGWQRLMLRRSIHQSINQSQQVKLIGWQRLTLSR